MKKYRIVIDGYSRFEVQCWRVWFPFWIKCGFSTHSNLEEAKQFIDNKYIKPIHYKPNFGELKKPKPVIKNFDGVNPPKEKEQYSIR